MAKDDVKLVGELLNDSSKAFNELFKRYSSNLYHFAFRYLKSEVEAEELVQDVFIKVWEKRHELVTSKSFKSYLFTIAYNNILKYFRKKTYHNEYLNQILDSSFSIENTEDHLNYKSAEETIDTYLSKLPSKKQLIFRKSKIEGLSAKEIATQMELTPGTVNNIISETLQYLRDKIDKDNLFLLLYLALFIS